MAPRAMERLRVALRDAARPFVLVPLLVVTLLAAPSLPYMLPSHDSELGEDYQPLMALKYFATLGSDFQKWGPMSNYLLAPGYALSLAYWKVTSAYDRPSGDYPYGFADPLHQLSFLLLQGRLWFLAIFLSLSAWSICAMRSLTRNEAAIALAFLFCVGTDFAVGSLIASTRPDGPMYAFVLASLGMYARILDSGLTRSRGVVLSLAAVSAISCKELAGTLYLLPYLGLGYQGLRATRGDARAAREWRRAAAWSVAAGVGSYLLLNAALSPSTWFLRMQHWLVAEGTDSAVWGGVASGSMSVGEYAVALALTFLDTLGPGGVPVALVSLAVLVAVRPKHWGMSLLPFASIFSFGLLPMGYTAERFHVTACLALFPPVALGLTEILRLCQSAPARTALRVGLAALLLVNLWFASFAWLRLEGLEARVIERSLVELPPGDRSVNFLDPSPRVQGKSRLDWLGYRVDARSMQQIMDAPPEDRPMRIYAHSGLLSFLEEAKGFPARAQVLRNQGFEIDRWPGLESLGYRRIATLETDTPWWFAFDWMQAVRYWRRWNPVYVYERPALESVAPSHSNRAPLAGGDRS